MKTDKRKIIDRMHRLAGQLRSIEKQINDDAPCDEIVPQLLAARGAMHAITREYFTCSLQNCSKDSASSKQLIEQLIKHI